jgi:hypothetical protein
VTHIYYSCILLYNTLSLYRFLLRRALGNPELIGHTFFWFLKAEMHVKEVAARFGVLLNLYMRKCGGYRTALGHQMLVMRQLETVAKAVALADSKEGRLKVLDVYHCIPLYTTGVAML